MIDNEIWKRVLKNALISFLAEIAIRHFPCLKVSPTKGNELYATPEEHKRMAPESQKVDLCYHCDIQNTIIIQYGYTFRYF
jgi:hypothetical protein